MSCHLYRACICVVITTFFTQLTCADDADTTKKIGKAGGYVVKINSEYGAAFDKTKASDEDLKLLLKLSNVTSLRLGENSNMTDAAFQTVGRLNNLKQLHVFKSNFTDNALLELQNLQNLEELILDGTKVEGPGLAGLRSLKKLKKLQLTSSGVTNEALKHIREIPNLYSLSLAGTKVTDEGLTDLRGMKNMGQLNLSSTAITDNGLRILASTSDFERLGYLIVNKTKVTKAGVEELKKARGKNNKKGFSVDFR